MGAAINNISIFCSHRFQCRTTRSPRRTGPRQNVIQRRLRLLGNILIIEKFGFNRLTGCRRGLGDLTFIDNISSLRRRQTELHDRFPLLINAKRRLAVHLTISTVDTDALNLRTRQSKFSQINAKLGTFGAFLRLTAKRQQRCSPAKFPLRKPWAISRKFTVSGCAREIKIDSLEAETRYDAIVRVSILDEPTILSTQLSSN